MPIIWETIIRKLSGTDVVNSLKVSKGLRSVLGQCLASNTQLHEEMNIAATVSAAVKSGKLQSTVQVKFKRKKFRDPGKQICDSKDATYSIDNVWFHKQFQTEHFNIAKLNQNNEVVFKTSLGTMKNQNFYQIQASSTRDDNMFFVADKGQINLVKITSNEAKIVSNRDDSHVFSFAEEYGRPQSVRYRLYSLSGLEDELNDRQHDEADHDDDDGNKGSSSIVMKFLDSDDEPTRSVVVFKSKKCIDDVYHTASNEEVTCLYNVL